MRSTEKPRSDTILKKRIFLAGATGVLGRRILPRLTAAGHEVTALVRRGEDVTELRGAEGAIADVYDRDALIRVVKAARPDVVMHQLTDLRGGSSAVNAKMRKIGTRNLVDAALAAGARRIVAQSIAWAYEGGDRPADEATPLDFGAGPPRRTTIDGVATLEAIVREAPEWISLRYGTLYGPDTWYSRHGMIGDKARAGELTADADVTSFVHVDDAAAAAVAALAWPSGAVNVCDREPAAGFDWVPAFCRAIDAPEPARAASEARQAWARGADSRYLGGELGFELEVPSWREGFARL